MTFKRCVAAAALALGGQGLVAQTFEGGIPDTWYCEGLCGALGADGSVALAPTGASKYGYVVTGTETPTGLGPFSFGGESSGSRLRSATFEAHAGDPLTLHFNYVSTDGSYNGEVYADYAYARLLRADDLSQVALLFTARNALDGSIVPGQDMPLPDATLSPGQVHIIADPDPSVGPRWSPLGDDTEWCFDVGCGYTGWVESNFNIAEGGKYVLEFGVLNWSDASFQTGLAFDFNLAGVSPIPEPETYALMLLGLGLMGGALRRRRSA